MFDMIDQSPNVDNFLDETLGTLEEEGLSPADVKRVIVYDDEPESVLNDPVGMDWNTFVELANGLSYRNDYGCPQLRAMTLVGDDFLMYRWGYDG